jgi:hypothetical protein
MTAIAMNCSQPAPARWLAAPRLSLALALFFACTAPALSDVRILSSGGGSVSEYLNFFAKVRQSGERVVIDGPCLSACTLVLSAVPRKRICVTSRAGSRLSCALSGRYEGSKNPLARDHQDRDRRLPANVRAWIKRHGGLTQKTILLKGRELAALYPRC